MTKETVTFPVITGFTATPLEEHDGIVLTLHSATDVDQPEANIFFHREQALTAVTLWMQAIEKLQKSDLPNARNQH